MHDGLHHTRLHSPDQAAACNASCLSTDVGQLVNPNNVRRRTKILDTALVILQAANGHSVTVRALLDPGAEESYVTEQLSQTLALLRERADMIISGVSCTTTAVAKCRVNLCLKSTKDTNFCIDFSALVLRKLTHLAPRRQVIVEDWATFHGLCFADHEWDKPSHIDCILDTEIYACVIH